MPRKKKTPVVTPAIDLPKEFLEKLIPGPMDAAGVEAVFQQLKKAVIERALGAELGLHPGRRRGRERQPPQRPQRQDGADRRGSAAHRRAARPDGYVRAAADPQARASLRRVRRSDRLDVRPRHDGA